MIKKSPKDSVTPSDKIEKAKKDLLEPSVEIDTKTK